MTHSLEPGLRARLWFDVTQAHTASALGSGSLPVLATPRLLAWCEQATCKAVEDALPTGRTSVGTRVELEHQAPSPVGSRACVEALLTDIDERTLIFLVDAIDRDRRPLAHGEVERVVVDTDRFMRRLA